LQVLPNLPADVALLVLLAAVLHASWNAIAKSGASKLLDITTMTVAAGAICAAALPFLLRPAALGMPGKGTLFALGNSAIIASYTLVDGQGTRLSANPVAYSLGLFVLNAFPLAALAVMRHGGGVWRHMRQRWAPGAIGGFPDDHFVHHRAVGDDTRADCGGCGIARDVGDFRCADR
jgi:hypothetical protein